MKQLRIFAIEILVVAFGMQGGSRAQSAPAAQHFEHVLVIVLENQSYVTAIKDAYLKQLAGEGVEFTNFRAVAHPSYPNYLAMIAGSTFGIHGMFGDSQQNFPDDDQHKTIADFLDWRDYAEEYPVKNGKPPYLGDTAGRYARKHVPFLSFQKIQTQGYVNVVSVNTRDAHNAFVSDVEHSRKDSGDRNYKPLPRYMFYSPNLDDDGHDTNTGTAATWLKNFMANWFPPDARRGTLIVVTFDEAYGPERASNRIYTVFVGDMVKKGLKVGRRYDHYDVLRTIEDNFGIAERLNVGDGKASVIEDIWN
jgi:phosphoesterase family protein